MSATIKTWLALCLLLSGALGACSSLVTVDRNKVPDDLYKMPDASQMDSGKPDAGNQEDAGTETEEDAGR